MTRHNLSPAELALAGSRRACVNCAHVKSKCTYRTDVGVCERCERLGKACAPSPSARPRGGRRHAGTRVARIEERLNEMVSILKTQSGSGDQGTELIEANSEINKIEHRNPMPPFQPVSQFSGNARPPQIDDESHDDGFSHTISTANTTPLSVLSYDNGPSLSEAEELLKRFRNERVLFFPFVYIPPHVTSSQLRDLYPFLWLNIMGTMSHSPTRRATLGDQARNMVIQRIVIDREKNLDLLFGLMTLVAWSHLRLEDRRYVTLFMRLIATLVCDLGLQRPEDNFASSPPVCLIIKENGPVRVPVTRKRRTDEERRAILGAFVLNSMLSVGFKVNDSLRWSSNFDDCLTQLSQTSTLPQDRILICQVRMQLIVNQIHHASSSAAGAEPPALYLSATRSHLYDINKGEDTNNFGLRLLFHLVELLINESAIRKSATPWNEPDLQRFDTYQRCLNSTKAWLDIFFSVPITSFADLPLTTFQNLIRVLVCLHRLSTTDDPAWDRKALSASLNLISTCDKVISLFERLRKLPIERSLEATDECWSFSIRVLTALRTAWYEEVEGPNETSYEDQMMDNFQNGMFGDFWMSDMFNSSWE